MGFAMALYERTILLDFRRKSCCKHLSRRPKKQEDMKSGVKSFSGRDYLETGPIPELSWDIVGCFAGILARKEGNSSRPMGAET